MNPNFHIYLWDRPIDVVLPWYAGQQRGVGMDEQTLAFATKDRVGMYEHPKNTSVPTYDEALSVCSAGKFSPPYWDTRLIQVKGSENVTILEAAFDLQDVGGGDQISSLVGGQFYEFIYSEYDEKPFVISFSVKKEHAVIRGITAHGSETTTSLSAWEFHEIGSPQSWEVISRYQAKRKIDRLKRDHLIEYLSMVGLDFQNYHHRRFERIIDFGKAGLAQDIIGYDDYALKVNEAFEARFEAIKAAF